MYFGRKSNRFSIPRYSASPILQVSENNSTSFDTTAQTVKPLEVFDYLQMKRKCYVFQLLKQFILFSSDQQDCFSSSQSQNQWYFKRYNLTPQKIELCFYSISSVIQRLKQKSLLCAYDRLKKSYFKKKLVYRNKEYVENIVEKIQNLIQEQHQQILQYVFIELIHNLKVSKLQEKIQMERRVPQFFQYEDRNFKTREYLPFCHDQQSRILRNDTQSFFESDSKIQIAKDLQIRNFRQNSSQNPHKDTVYKQKITTARLKSNKLSKTQKKKQVIYLIDTSGKKSDQKIRYQVQKHIKIPIQTQNVNIVRIQEQDKYSNKKKLQFKNEIMQNFDDKDCSSCRYCQKIRQRQQKLTKHYLFK